MPSLRLALPKQPRFVLDNVFAFPPNRDTLGATAYLIVEKDAKILIDCPVFDETTREFLQQQGGVDWLLITHRGSIGKAMRFQQEMGCAIVVQEREAYLLKEATVTPFGSEMAIPGNCLGIWTPGHSPGSSCWYYTGGGGILFSGRHLLPDRQGNPVPLRTAKTFHWGRQIKSVKLLLDRFSSDTLQLICPGANTGFLRGERGIESAYEKLSTLDLDTCLRAKALL
jgi:glyoxylase-like metal-dependent hydrolase (beta-lactamase superfamily II)